jgi:hypothetical protein
MLITITCHGAFLLSVIAYFKQIICTHNVLIKPALFTGQWENEKYSPLEKNLVLKKYAAMKEQALFNLRRVYVNCSMIYAHIIF